MTEPQRSLALRVEPILGALLRVCRIGAMHLPNNEAVTQTVSQAARAVDAAWDGEDDRVSLLFVDDTLYVSGQLVRLSPDAMAVSIELATMLERIGANELVVYRGAAPDALRAVAAAFQGAGLPQRPARVVVRRVDPELLAALRDTEASARERLRQSYATAMVAMRLVFDAILEQRFVPPGNLRSVVRQMLVLADEDPDGFRQLCLARPTHHDEAGRAVRTLIVTLAAARAVGAPEAAMVPLGVAALLAEVGRARAARPARDEETRRMRAIPSLDESRRARLPLSTVSSVLALPTGAGTLERAALLREAASSAIGRYEDIQ